MSKGSQQQSIPPRDRAASAPSRSKQPTNGVKANAQEAAKPVVAGQADEFGVVPTESAEDDFFARGEAAHSSLPPAAMDLLAEHDLDDRPEVVTLTPAQIERRGRLRRIVGGVVGAAAVLTAVVGAKALAAPTKVTAADGTLNVPHQVVASIAMPPAQQEPPAAAPENAPTAEIVAATEPAAPPAEQAAPSGEKIAEQEGTAAPAAQGGDTAAKEVAAAQARRLPVIDIEIPVSTDPAVDLQWASAAKNLSSKDFKGADTAFAELGKRPDPATRETARLARAAWWKANGRQNEVKPVIADLAANATTPSVRQQAHDLLSRAN
jgi:hypothetical protein